MHLSPTLVRAFAATALTAGFIFAAPAGLAASKNTGKARRAELTDAFFASTNVVRVEIQASDAAIATLRKYEWKFGQQTERESVQVTVRAGNTTYTNVALHLKGAAGSFQSVDQKPAMTLNFERFAKGQRFHGLTKLSLNNSVQDPTYVSEQFCRELFLKAGVPTPRATHATVSLNGRDLGLYVLVEGWDKEFLQRHFQTTGGNLYDGGFLKDVTDELSTNAGENPKKQDDRIALAEAAKESNLTNRMERLEKILDVERFITFMAMDVMLWDWDGYPQNRNNWRLYYDRDKERLVFMPHGLDQMFWKPEGSILPRMQGLVARAVLEIPAWRERYFERMKELRASVFHPEQMVSRARQISASKIEPVLKSRDEGDLKDQQHALDTLCHAMLRRGKSLDDQLARPIKPLQFESDGTARLAGWESKVDFGAPELTRSDAPLALGISAPKGSSIGSWRTRVWLEKGRYRIESRLKTDGITPDPGDPRAGAGFRLIRSRPQDYALGTSDWREKGHEFSVDDSLVEVQLACEFRGTAGKALFDLESLRLRKLESKPDAK